MTGEPRRQASLNYDDLSVDELKCVLTNLMSRLELAKTALAKKVDTPKMVAAKVTGTFPDLPWGGGKIASTHIPAPSQCVLGRYAEVHRHGHNHTSVT